MIIFVTHEYNGWPVNIEKVKSIVRFLNMVDNKNSYICQFENKNCTYDKLLVAGRITQDMRLDIDFAKVNKIPISYYAWHPERINPIRFLHI